MQKATRKTEKPACTNKYNHISSCIGDDDILFMRMPVKEELIELEKALKIIKRLEKITLSDKSNIQIVRKEGKIIL